MATTHRSWIQFTGGLLLALVFAAANGPDLRYGRADNGDNARLAGHWLRGPAGYALWPAREDTSWGRRFFGCWHRVWELRPAAGETKPAPPIAPDVGTSSLVWRLVFGLGRAAGAGSVDLLALGLLLRAGCLAALLLLYGCAVRHFRERGERRATLLALGLTLPLALLVADPRYTTFFNSLYREGGTLLFALLTPVCLLAFSGSRVLAPLLGAAAAGLLLAGSASAHFFTGLLTAGALAAALLRRELRREPRSRRRRVVEWAATGAAVAALLLAGSAAERGTERNLRKNAAYHSLFLGALQVSDDPAGHLAYLGLPPTARERIGIDAFHAESNAFIREHWDRIGHRATAHVLLREPVLILRLLRHGAEKLYDPFLSMLLIYHEACDYRPLAFAGWSALKSRLLPDGLAVLAGLAGAALLGAVSLFHRDRRVFGVGLALAFASSAALGEIAVSVFGDGFADLGRHLIAASLFADLTLVLLLWRLALAAWSGPFAAPLTPEDGDARAAPLTPDEGGLRAAPGAAGS